MSTLTSEQRDNRDQMSARAAIEMAYREGKVVAIAVDNKRKVRRMVRRVLSIVRSMDLDHTIHTTEPSGSTDVMIGSGVVRIFGMLDR